MLDSIFYTSYVALWALVIFQTLVLLGLVRQVSTNREALNPEVNPPEDALPSGSLAPEFQTLEARAKQLVQSRNWVGRPTILVFMSPHCSVCDLVAEEVENFGRRVKAQLAVLCHGEMSECVQFAATHFSEATVLLDEGGAIAKQFRVDRTPMAILLDSDWKLLRYGFPRSSPRLGLDELLKSKENGREPVLSSTESGRIQ